MSASDNYCTPSWFTALLPPVDLDPCSNENSTVVARRAIALPYDGLAVDWLGTVYVNCPYSQPLPWVLKAVESTRWVPGVPRVQQTSVAMLLKLDTTTMWYSALVEAGAKIYVFRRRVTFAGAPQGANFCSMLAIVGDVTPWRPLIDELIRLGQVWGVAA